jgi:hypothetical protein
MLTLDQVAVSDRDKEQETSAAPTGEIVSPGPSREAGKFPAFLDFVAAIRGRFHRESRKSLKRFTQVAAEMNQRAEQEHAVSLRTEANRFRADFVSEIDRIAADAAAKLSLWSNKKAAAIQPAVDSAADAAKQRMLDEVKKAEEELKVALQCRKAALTDRYSASVEKSLVEILAQTEKDLEKGIQAQGRKMLPEAVEKLREAMGKSASGVLEEFSQAARHELTTALAAFREDATRKLNTTLQSASKSIDEVSKSIEHDIAEVKMAVAEQTLSLRDQLRREEDYALEQAAALRAGVEDALSAMRGRMADALSRPMPVLVKVERQARKLEKDAQSLESRRASIDAKLASLTENVAAIDANNQHLVLLSLQLSEQMEASLNGIERETARAREYLTSVSGRMADLRAAVEQVVKDYEDRSEELRRELDRTDLTSAAHEVAEQARRRLDAELEYRLLAFRRELKEIEEEVLRQASAAERAMVREATLLVRSRRSEVYANKVSQREGETNPKPRRLLCANCGRKLRYIAQYSRWYCDFCKKYAPRGVEQTLDSSPEKTLMSWYEDVWKGPHETNERDQTGN